MEKQKENSGSRTFTRKDGHKSSILMRKKGEKDEGFFKRMDKYGWAQDDIKSGHSKPDSNEYHAGLLTDCSRCNVVTSKTLPVIEQQVKTEDKKISPDVKSTDEKVKASKILVEDGKSFNIGMIKDDSKPTTKVGNKSLLSDINDLKPTVMKGIDQDEPKTK